MIDVTQLLPLEIIIPLLGALLCSLKRNFVYNSGLSLIITFACLIVSILLFKQTFITHEITYNMGGWPREYGIQLRLTNFNCIILALVNLIAFTTSIYGLYAIPKEVAKNKILLFYTAFLLCYLGLIGIIITNDIFNLYVFLEISSLATYTLVASSGTKKAYIAAFDYLIIGTISATFYLIGVGFLYSITGTLNMEVLAEKIPEIINSRITQVGAAFIITGIVMKSALFPMHLWLTKAYAYSNSFAVSFISGTSTKVGIYVLIKYIYLVLGAKLLFDNLLIDHLFISLSALAILVGAFYALLQDDIKKILAYSSVSQIGCIVLAAFLNTGFNLTVVILFIITHSLAKTSLFMITGYIHHTCGTTEIKKIEKHFSSISIIYFLISAFSLIGIPLTGGFISKFYLLNLTLSNHNYLATMWIVISSAIAALYTWGLLQVFIQSASSEISFPKILNLPLIILCGLNIFIGFYAKSIIDLIIRI